MGDAPSLIEQAEQVFDAEKAEEAAAKIGSGEATLEDSPSRCWRSARWARSATCWVCCPAPVR